MRPNTIHAIFLCALTTSYAHALDGQVVGVADGDTITVLDADRRRHKVRLMGIDAPEKNQPFGQNAKQSLSGLVFGRAVFVDGQKLDRYGRTVGKVMVDGLDANLEQIRRGLAWHYKKYADEQDPRDRADYTKTEIEARMDKRGLWADPLPTPPWDWRRSQK